MTDSNNKVVVRVPPSPTGWLHVGTARTVLFNYLFAKQHNGKIILRSEDTDKIRSKKEYEDDIVDNLAWLGFQFDEFHRQSERGEIYKKYLQKLIDADKAYISKEEVKEEGQRAEVIRFRNPGGKITFHDLIRGDITFDVTELGDFVIAKSLEEPLYHLAVVVDDIDMGVTHIIRGDDHISNTPRQILLVEALDGERSIYAHLPLMLATDKAKLSKRKHGESVAIKYYREQGYLPEAMINFLALVGWNPGTEEEIFSMDELIKIFKIENIQKGGAVFNVDKLNSINRQYLRSLPLSEIEKIIHETKANLDQDIVRSIAPLVVERVDNLMQVRELITSGEFDYFFNPPSYPNPDQIVWKKDTKESTKTHLTKVLEILKEGKGSTEIMHYAEEAGKGSVLWPLRYSLSGKEKSPDPITILGIIGVHEAKNRIKKAIDALA